MTERSDAKSESGCVKIYGHRGARGECQENTITGFLHAKTAGADGIETDIALTADFMPVLHHDPDLPDGRLIRDLKFAELKGIPTLSEALHAVQGMEWLLEIKTYPQMPGKSHPPASIVRSVIAALNATEIPNEKIHILAFDWAVLREVQAQAPMVRRICLTSPKTEAAKLIWQGSQTIMLTNPYGVAATGATGWAPFHGTLTLSQIREAQKLGLKIFPWTVNNPKDFERLSMVDGIITDYPSRFTQRPR